MNERAEQIMDDSEALDRMRHTASHVMAQAVCRLFPEVKLGIGPTIQDGFYYDFLFGREFSRDDFAAIEAEMKRIIKESFPLERFVLSREDALERTADQPFKRELIRDLPPEEEISFYRQGEFTDLCRGPHAATTREVKVFRILSTSGAYWRGDEKQPMLQRIYGTAFFTKGELAAYLKRLKEAEKRDHRKLGARLGLFETFPEEAGSGMVFWLEEGAKLRETLLSWARRINEQEEYKEVITPHLIHTKMWEKSGHLANFKSHMFIAMEEDGEGMGVKPMNCPGHMLLFGRKRRSYRELPIRMAEFGTVYRNEKGGTMHGLFRVRGFTQDDAHIFCRPDQLQGEIVAVLNHTRMILERFGFKWRTFLKGRPEKSIGDDSAWERAEKALEEAAVVAGIEPVFVPKDGAFYGPKIDFEIEDALGRDWQCSTIQIDFNLPERFNLKYVNEHDVEEAPVLIHRAIFGSFERFIGILIEHYGGSFPLWLAPVQAIILPIADRHQETAVALATHLESAGIRPKIEGRNETIGKKIRAAEIQRVPYMLVLGDRETENATVSVRHRDEGDLGSMTTTELLARMEAEKAV